MNIIYMYLKIYAQANWDKKDLSHSLSDVSPHINIPLVYFLFNYNIIKTPLPPRPPKVTTNLKSYLQKYLILIKTNQILEAIIEKIKYCLFKKTVSCSQFRVNVVTSRGKYENVTVKPFLIHRKIKMERIYQHLRIPAAILLALILFDITFILLE